MTPEKQFDIVIEHLGVRYPIHAIFHDAQTMDQVGTYQIERAAHRIGEQIMEAIDKWTKGELPPGVSKAA